MINVRYLIPVVAALVTLVMGGAIANAQEAPAELQAAIEANVTERGYPYAGECAVSQDLDEDTGKWCSETTLQGTLRAAVRIGPTFAEYHRRLTFELQAGEWVVVSDAPDDGLRPPSVGTGASGSDESQSGLPVVALGAALLTASAAAFAVSRARMR